MSRKYLNNLLLCYQRTRRFFMNNNTLTNYFAGYVGDGEMELFLNSIHHTHDREHAGKIHALIKTPTSILNESFNTIEKLASFLESHENTENHVYVSLNEFSGNNRRTANLYAVNVITENCQSPLL